MNKDFSSNECLFPYKFTCDECGQKFEILTEPHAGVREYFKCTCGKKYWIERALINKIRKISGDD